MLKRLAGIRSALPLSSAEELLFFLLAAAVSAAVLSIAASQILLAAAIVTAGRLWTENPGVLSKKHPMVWPLAALFLWTLIAAQMASDIRVGLIGLKKFFLFSLLFLVPMACRGTGRIRLIYYVVFAAAGVSSLTGVLQFVADPNRDLLHRISGFMSQWMTYSGLLMLAMVVLTACIAVDGYRKHWWAIPLFCLVLTPLVLSETRNAWLGALSGIMIIVALKNPRAIALALSLVALLFLLSPSRIQERLRTGWNPEDPNTRNRIELSETALRLIRDNPWFGLGPNNVKTGALRYRGSEEYPDWLYQHMHNNFLQIAAERGIPGMLLWLWFMGRLAWDAIRLFRRARSDCRTGAPSPAAQEALFASIAALGAWSALMIAGLFEYNFGDSEVLTLFLFIMAAPYAFLGAEAFDKKDRSRQCR